MNPPDDVRAALEKWLREGDRIRDALLAEREDLTRRLREIDAALATLPPPRSPVEAQGIALQSSVASALVAGVRALHPSGATPQDLMNWVQQTKPDFDVRQLHTYLARLTAAGTIHFHGTRGQRRYFMGDGTQPHDENDHRPTEIGEPIVLRYRTLAPIRRGGDPTKEG